MVDAADALFAEAEHLDAEAVRVGRDTESARALRARAAALKVKALGARVYPVVICSSCSSVTGWTGVDGKCDSCLRADVRHAAFTDPHGGWVQVNDRRPRSPRAKTSLRQRLSALAGGKVTSNRSWLSRVEPGDTGPIDPEQGYELEMARRDEVTAADGSGMVVRFTTQRHRFAGADWLPLDATRIPHGGTRIPTEFSAGLPIEQLAEAWGDYREAVDSFNRTAWAQESDARAAALRSREEREDALRDQRHVADLLDEN